MPAKMIIEIPLPMPALGDLLAQPHEEHGARHEGDDRHQAEREARVDHERRL